MKCKDCKHFKSAKMVSVHDKTGICKKVESFMGKIPSDLRYRLYGTLGNKELMVLETDGSTCGHFSPKNTQ